MFRDPQKDDKYKQEKCDMCEGTGKDASECCNFNVIKGLCSKCKEHAEVEDCENCSGTGYVTYNADERKIDSREDYWLNSRD